MVKATYIAAMEASPEGGFGVYFPDLPGCVSAGETEAEARAGAAEALALHLEGMAEDGEALPRPTAYDAFDADSFPEGFLYLFVVNAETKARSAPMMVRINVMLAEPLVERIGRAAGKTHRGNRSSWLSDAARDFLAKQMTQAGTTDIDQWDAK